MNDLLTFLHLKYVEKKLPELLEQARLHSLTYEAFLRRVLTLEIEGRKAVASHNREKTAKLPVRKTLEEFHFSFQPTLSDRLLWELAELSFLKTHTNCSFGPAGRRENSFGDQFVGQSPRSRLFGSLYNLRGIG